MNKVILLRPSGVVVTERKAVVNKNPLLRASGVVVSEVPPADQIRRSNAGLWDRRPRKVPRSALLGRPAPSSQRSSTNDIQQS